MRSNPYGPFLQERFGLTKPNPGTGKYGWARGVGDEWCTKVGTWPLKEAELDPLAVARAIVESTTTRRADAKGAQTPPSKIAGCRRSPSTTA